MIFNMCGKRTACLVISSLVLALVLSACGGNGSGKTNNNGIIGKGDGWVLKEDGTLTVSYKGAMPTLEQDTFDISPWCNYKSQIKKVVIEDGVTDICSTAFAYGEYLESITIPDSVTYIGSNAFTECMRLQSVTIPESVTAIAADAFMCCRGLGAVVIPKSVESIGDRAFASCDMVQSVTLNEGLRSIGNNAFGFTTLRTLVLPEGLETIGDSAFTACRDLEELTVPASVSKIGDGAFPHNIKKINYAGTKEGWTSLVPVPFYYESAVIEIVCSDGVITWQNASAEVSSQQ